MKIIRFIISHSSIKIISDMAPNFVGDRDTDHMNISALNSVALKLSFNNLKTGGTLLMKTLNGALESRFFVHKYNYMVD